MTLTAQAPSDLLQIAAVRTECEIVSTEYGNTELRKRIDAVPDSEGGALVDEIPPEEYRVFKRWLLTGLPETIECITGYAVDGVPHTGPIEEVRVALHRDERMHPALRRMRQVLFFGTKDDGDDN